MFVKIVDVKIRIMCIFCCNYCCASNCELVLEL